MLTFRSPETPTQYCLAQGKIRNTRSKGLPPPESRNELPPVLAGLQWIFVSPEVNGQTFELLEKKVVGVKNATGRPGLDLWHILALRDRALGAGF